MSGNSTPNFLRNSCSCSEIENSFPVIVHIFLISGILFLLLNKILLIYLRVNLALFKQKKRKKATCHSFLYLYNLFLITLFTIHNLFSIWRKGSRKCI